MKTPPVRCPSLRVTLTCLVSAALTVGSLHAAEQTNRLTASQVLDEFAKAQGQLKTFIAQYEFSRQENVSTLSGRSSWFLAGDTRIDGRRVSVRKRLWGRITPDTVRTKERPYYKSRSFDGQWRWQYDQPFWRPEDVPRGQTGTGTVMLRQVLNPPQTAIALLDFCESPLTHCLGVLLHDGSKRFDARLREAASLRVRDKLEPAGWEPSPCYVLEANTPHGQYTVWLAPAHGFQMAKAILRRQPGHRRANDYTLTAGESDLSFVEKVRFAKSGEVWIPIEAAGGLDNAFAGGVRSSFRFQLKTTQFLLNPDPAFLRAG